MIDLKPCPHCGGRVRFNHNAELLPDGIFCPNCHMLVRFTTIQADRKDKFEVVMDRIAGAWNRREDNENKTD